MLYPPPPRYTFLLLVVFLRLFLNLYLHNQPILHGTYPTHQLQPLLIMIIVIVVVVKQVTLQELLLLLLLQSQLVALVIETSVMVAFSVIVVEHPQIQISPLDHIAKKIAASGLFCLENWVSCNACSLYMYIGT